MVHLKVYHTHSNNYANVNVDAYFYLEKLVLFIFNLFFMKCIGNDWANKYNNLVFVFSVFIRMVFIDN